MNDRTTHIVLLAVMLAALSGCNLHPFDVWTAYVYPNKTNLQEHVDFSGFSTLEECRATAVAAVEARRATRRGDYECGLNFKPDDSLPGINVCETTLR